METSAAVGQLNILAVDYTYRMPVELFGAFDKETGRRTAPKIGPYGRIKVISDIYTFSVRNDGGQAYCTRTYGLFGRDSNVSESTARRAVNAGIEIGLITRSEECKNAYRFDTGNNYTSGGHYKLEAWMTRPTAIGDNILTLSNAEQIVAAFFNSECNRAPQEYSVNDIALKLDMSVPTARKAIDKFTDKKFSLVFRLEVGKNKYRKSKYIINKKLFRTLNRAEAKKQKAIAKANEKNADKRSDTLQDNAEFKEALKRERYEREERRKEAVKKTWARALADLEFKTSVEALDSLAPRLAFAELRNMPDYPKLKKEADIYAHRKEEALKRLNIGEAEFSENFHVLCPECRDTLILANGRVCKCFARGSPPNND